MKTLLILIQLTISATLFSQGNLQFNRAVNIELTSTITGSSIGANYRVTVSTPPPVTLTVPVGKTLKITNCAINYHVDINSINSPHYINGANYDYNWGILLLNNINVASFKSETISSTGFPANHYKSFDYTQTKDPIWLPAGTYIISIEKYTLPIYDTGYPHHTQTITSRVSGIEFNIIP